MTTPDVSEKPSAPSASTPASGSAADEYLKTHASAKWCPVCGFIYLMRFAPVLTTTTTILAVIIGGCMGHHAASR